MIGIQSLVGPEVLIVDRLPLFRFAIRQIAISQLGIDKPIETGSWKKIPEICSESNVKLLILACERFSGVNPQFFADLKQQFPDLTIIAMGQPMSDAEVEKLFLSGVDAWLYRTCTEAELKEALYTLQRGERYYTQASAGEQGQEKSVNPNSLVTKREKEILKLIFQEHTNPEIATLLNISRRTVDTHRKNLLRKLSVKNTAGLIRFALRNGLLTIED